MARAGGVLQPAQNLWDRGNAPCSAAIIHAMSDHSNGTVTASSACLVHVYQYLVYYLITITGGGGVEGGRG